MDLNSVRMIVMNQMGQWSGVFRDQVRTLLFALAVFIFGLMVSEIIKRVGVVFLNYCGWDDFCRRAGLSAVLRKWRPDVTPTAALGGVLFWASLVSFFMKSLERMELPWVSELGRTYFVLLPLVLQASALLLACWLLARLVSGFILRVVGHPAAFLASGLIQALIFNLGFYAALVKLGLEPGLAQTVMLIVLSGTVLAVALAWTFKGEPRFRSTIRVHDEEVE